MKSSNKQFYSICSKIIISILFFIINTTHVQAQFKITSSMGILSLGKNMVVNSNPITLVGKNCVQVNSGLTKFIKNNNGVFLNECVVDINYIKLSIQIAPNPVNNYTTIKFKEKVSVDNNFKVILMSELGNIVKTDNVLQNTFLYGGYTLNMSNLATGIYYIHIGSNSISESYKIIKY